MKGGFKSTPCSVGFTIVEVMVFLAVSGFTFLIAASFINGKEAQAEYNTGMNQAELQVRTIMNDVSDGNYTLPAGESLNCSLTGNGPSVSSAPASPTGVASAGCTFVGEVLEPDYNGNPEQYYLFKVAGCQNYTAQFASYRCSNNANDPAPTDLEEEQPQVVNFLSGMKVWQNSITLDGIYQVNGSVSSPGSSWNKLSALGVFGSFPSLNNGVMESGAQPVALVYFNGTTSQTVQDIASLGTNNPAGHLLTSGYIVMCLSGGSGKSGAIVIGSDNGGQQITTSELLGQKAPSRCVG